MRPNWRSHRTMAGTVNPEGASTGAGGGAQPRRGPRRPRDAPNPSSRRRLYPSEQAVQGLHFRDVCDKVVAFFLPCNLRDV